jgi:hypothetical protein
MHSIYNNILSKIPFYYLPYFFLTCFCCRRLIFRRKFNEKKNVKFFFSFWLDLFLPKMYLPLLLYFLSILSFQVFFLFRLSQSLYVYLSQYALTLLPCLCPQCHFLSLKISLSRVLTFCLNDGGSFPLKRVKKFISLSLTQSAL